MASKGLFSTQRPMFKSVAYGDRVSRDLRSDIEKELAKVAPITVEEYVNPATAAPTAILLAKACTLLAQTYLTAALDGAVGAAVMPYGRNITVTTTGDTPLDAPATATITGVRRGVVITEAISVPQTATTAVGTKAFDKVTKVELTVGQGTDAAVSVGFGPALGTVATAKSRQALCNILAETAAGAKVSNGVLTAQLYTPNTAPNGTNDYVIYFEFDATVVFTP